MAARTRSARKAAAPAPAPEPEVDETEEEELDRYEKLMEKEPTQKQRDCAAWIEEKTGYEVDLKTVQLVLALYSTFQKSPENQKAIEDAKARAAEAAEARANRAEDRKENKGAGKTKRRSSRAEEPEEDEEEAPKTTRRRATAVQGATRTRRSRTAASADGDF